MRRVMLLGIDGLEYSLVDRWNLSGLKQLEYTKTTIPGIRSGEEPNSPIIWTSIITGCTPEELGYNDVRHIESDFLDDFYHYFRRKYPGSERILKFFHRKKNKLPGRESILKPTIFDDSSIRSKHYHIPVYDSDAFPEYWSIGTHRASKDSQYRRIYEEGCREEFKQRTHEALYLAGNNDWDFAMIYFFFLDGIQHVYTGRIEKIREYYEYLDLFVQEMSILFSDIIMMVVSDHGVLDGVHTSYGFFSTNFSSNGFSKDISTEEIKDFVLKKLKTEKNGRHGTGRSPASPCTLRNPAQAEYAICSTGLPEDLRKIEIEEPEEVWFCDACLCDCYLLITRRPSSFDGDKSCPIRNDHDARWKKAESLGKKVGI